MILARPNHAKRQVATRNGSWIGDQVPFVQIAREEGQDQIQAPVEDLSRPATEKTGGKPIGKHIIALWRNHELETECYSEVQDLSKIGYICQY